MTTLILPPTFGIWFPLVAMSVMLQGCALGGRNAGPRLRTVSHVDLPRYMGHWRVIAEIPYFAERGGVDSVEMLRAAAGRINLQLVCDAKGVIHRAREEGNCACLCGEYEDERENGGSSS